MDNCLISVIIPVFNVEEYLHHCVMSVINQKYKNLEIILVDDGSTDNSPAICDELATTDSRIKVIHKNNGGLSSARNKGLDISTGKYIAFVDSDDYVHPEYISRMYNLITKENAGIVACGFRKTFKNKESFKYPKINSKGYEVLDYREALEELVGLNSVTYVLSWNKLYKRGVFEGIRFPEGKISEDFYVSFKVLHQGAKTIVTKDQLYYYFLRKGSIINRRDNISDYNIEALDEFDEYTEKLGLDLKAKSLFIRMNSVMEDYWAAYKNKNKSRMEKMDKSFNDIKARMEDINAPLNHKARLFDSNKTLFIFERGLIGFVGNIKIRLNLYR